MSTATTRPTRTPRRACGSPAPGSSSPRSATRVRTRRSSSARTVTYDITVTNTGDTTLDPLTVGDTWDGAVLAFDAPRPASPYPAAPARPGRSVRWRRRPARRCELTLKATGWPASLSTTDVASVTATDTYGDPPPPRLAAASVMITHPDVAIAKSLAIGQDPSSRWARRVTFDLRITNTGNVGARHRPGDRHLRRRLR